MKKRPQTRTPRTADIEAKVRQAASLQRQGRFKEAERAYESVLQAHPAQFDALHLLGVLRGQRGDTTEAARLISLALEQRPNSAEANLNLGIALGKLARHRDALTAYDKALAVRPDYFEVLFNRGNSLAELGRHEEAVASYDRAVALRPDHVNAWYNRGNSLRALRHYGDAIASYDKLLAIRPDHADALLNRGNAFRELNRHAEALASYEQALKLRPDYTEVHNNCGNALQSLGRSADALASYDRALAIRPDYANALYNRGTILAKMNRHEEAAENFEKTLVIDSGYKYALGAAAHSHAQVCNWERGPRLEWQLQTQVRAAKVASLPFPFLSISADPADQLLCAHTFVRDRYPAVLPPLWLGERYRHERIRLAYLSADFHDHATAYLMAGLFEQHDRKRFEITALSFGPASRGEMRSRLKKAFERFVDVRDKSDREVAQLLRELEIDIAVDLKGFTTDARTGIFTHRAAPIQVNYLGYPGTMGVEYIDYILADRIVIPEEHQPYYAEKVVYLPDCYQVNDAGRKVAERTPSRAEAGLPERGFVFCSFNNNYKINPPVFEVWMRLLGQVEGSVLWLLEANPAAARNLRREAQARGVDPKRLVFASRVKLPEHLARHRLADLFLDTLPYNAHTTASDALWVGLPVLTCLGTTFAGRVAASLLSAIGLPELITRSLQEYEALALALAREPQRLQSLKDKLARNRLATPLFDTARFTHHIEAAFTTMWQNLQAGHQPVTFAVGPFV